MMAWLVLLVMAVAAFVALLRYGRLPRSAIELVGAAILVGVVGYAFQGSPTQTGSSVEARQVQRMAPDPGAIAIRRAMTGRFGADAQWLDLADVLIARGETQTAIIAVRSGLRDNRYSSALWVGLGNALVAHGDGFLSPSAEFAYRRAAQLSPKSPAPPFFYGLSLAQMCTMAQ
jgi:cytochrome c-type biogenesis protein CcmH